MTNSNYAMRQSNIAATMSVVAFLTGIHAAADASQRPSAGVPVTHYQSPFIPSSATEVMVTHYSAIADAQFDAAIHDFYGALARKQRRLDTQMAAVLAASAWDLYETD